MNAPMWTLLAALAVGLLVSFVLRHAERWADDAVTEELDLARNVRELRAMRDTPLRASDEHYMALTWRDHPWTQQ